MDASPEPPKPPAGVLAGNRERAVAELGGLHVQRERLATMLRDLDAKIAAYHADILAMDKVASVL